ncbi:MAG: hypothetical protein KDA42_19915, partial [Planctomycetales bacterium]|nr:hypothetical protein [Planctomycetales bacterium]
NSAGVPGASDEVWDFGDAAPDGAGSAGYGSLQVHNHDAGQTILAYNAWGNPGVAGDAGIGNRGSHAAVVAGAPALTGPIVLSVDPPIYGVVDPNVTRLTIDFSEAITSASALDSANYQLISPGANGTFEDGGGDDVVIPLTVEFDGATHVELVIDGGASPLPDGDYQLTIDGDGSIEDPDGNPLHSNTGPGGGDNFVHRFSIGAVNDQLSPDWTFANNVDQYEIRNLYVLVREAPGLAITEPFERVIVQRDENNQGQVEIAGRFDTTATHVEVRAIPVEGFGGTATDWVLLDDTIENFEFRGLVTLDAGWYRVEVRGFDGATELNTDFVDEIGVGDIYVTAGQSNSANHGDTLLTPDDPRVSAFNGTSWIFGADPQPIATGTLGSPWPELGDLLAAHYDVPIGFYNVGWGGTKVSQWQPEANDKYPRLRDAVTTLGENGFRAVLWHQGESDFNLMPDVSLYTGLLEHVIEQSRIDAGFDVPWGVARVSYVPPNVNPDLIAAQDAVIANDLLVFAGPNTDELVGSPWRDNGGAGIHFSEEGLLEHARLWSESIFTYFDLLNVRRVSVSAD